MTNENVVLTEAHDPPRNFANNRPRHHTKISQNKHHADLYSRLVHNNTIDPGFDPGSTDPGSNLDFDPGSISDLTRGQILILARGQLTRGQFLGQKCVIYGVYGGFRFRFDHLVLKSK